jgi:hypothetical protein
MVESLWSIPAADNVRAPLMIMKEQAAALTKQTKGSLVGSVEPVAYGNGLVINLSVEVPALNNYRYHVMTYEQPITMYPGTLASQVPAPSGTGLYIRPKAIKVNNEEEFLVALKALLASDEVKRLVSSLLVQANAA